MFGSKLPKCFDTRLNAMILQYIICVSIYLAQRLKVRLRNKQLMQGEAVCSFMFTVKSSEKQQVAFRETSQYAVLSLRNGTVTS